LTLVAIAQQQAVVSNGEMTITAATVSGGAPAMGASVQRATTVYDLMGRATDYKEFAVDGTTQTYRRQATYDRTGLVTDDRVEQGGVTLATHYDYDLNSNEAMWKLVGGT
jgi:hypothetical protein